MSNELAVFVPEPKIVKIRGVDVKVAPLKLRQFPVMLKAFSVFSDKAALKDGVGKADWLEIFSNHSDKIIEAIAVATEQPQNWVLDLYPDEGILLAEAIWEVNQDFFVQRVLPTLLRALAGAPRLPDSLAPVTH